MGRMGPLVSAIGTCMKSSIVHNPFFINERFIYEPCIMNSFFERFFVQRFCYVLPLRRPHGVEHDACSAQWCHQSSGQQVFQLVGPNDVINPPHLCPIFGGNGPDSPPGGPRNQGAGHPYVCRGPLSRTQSDRALFQVGAPPSGLRVLCGYISRRGNAYTARNGLPFPRPIPRRDQFDAMWKSLTALVALSPAVECADPPLLGVFWPSWSWAQYVHSRPALCQSIDWTLPLTSVSRGDGYPCAGGSWSQLSLSLLNHGVKARTPAFLWVVGMAVTGHKDMVALGQIWAQVLQVCSMHFRVHMLFMIRPFINPKYRS